LTDFARLYSRCARGDEAMCYQVKNDKGEGVDVFYVVSTWEFDWLTEDGIVLHDAGWSGLTGQKPTKA
jgi:hypothetical protein